MGVDTTISMQREVTGFQHFMLMLAASFLSLFLCAVGVGIPLAFYLLLFVGIFFAHCVTPLLYLVYCPLTLKYWQMGKRGIVLFCATGLWVAALNGFALGLLIQGGQGALGTDPFEIVEVFRFVPIYTICGLMTGALHWFFLTLFQRKLEKEKNDGTPRF